MVALNEATYKRAAKDLEEMTLRMIASVDLIDSMKELGLDSKEAEKKQAELQSTMDRFESLLTRKGYWPIT